MHQPVTPNPAGSALARTLSDPSFLSSLCHDLRGPLGAIGTWIHVLGSERADAATREQALAAMRRDVAAQEGMIEQLADLAALSGGMLALTVAEVDLASPVAEVSAGLQVEGPPPRVRVDPKRFRQILEILLPAPTTDTRTRPVLTTKANDEGMCVLQGFVRQGGPSLVGLTLARALTEVQGGDLAISETVEGTVFVLRLPAVEGAAAAPSA